MHPPRDYTAVLGQGMAHYSCAIVHRRRSRRPSRSSRGRAGACIHLLLACLVGVGACTTFLAPRAARGPLGNEENQNAAR
jgi:hypothetical protein